MSFLEKPLYIYSIILSTYIYLSLLLSTLFSSSHALSLSLSLSLWPQCGLELIRLCRQNTQIKYCPKKFKLMNRIGTIFYKDNHSFHIALFFYDSRHPSLQLALNIWFKIFIIFMPQPSSSNLCVLICTQ